LRPFVHRNEVLNDDNYIDQAVSEHFQDRGMRGLHGFVGFRAKQAIEQQIHPGNRNRVKRNTLAIHDDIL
jgi:hypothetical protein